MQDYRRYRLRNSQVHWKGHCQRRAGPRCTPRADQCRPGPDKLMSRRVSKCLSYHVELTWSLRSSTVLLMGLLPRERSEKTQRHAQFHVDNPILRTRDIVWPRYPAQALTFLLGRPPDLAQYAPSAPACTPLSPCPSAHQNAVYV